MTAAYSTAGDGTGAPALLIDRIAAVVGLRYVPRDVAPGAPLPPEEALSDDIATRTMARLLEAEIRMQANMEAIIAAALAPLPQDARPDDIAADWIAHFFEKCRIVSDGEMQNLWGRVLAAEAGAPGSFSRRTVAFLATMDRKDAHDFTNLCRYAVQAGGPLLLIHEITSSYFPERGIDFPFLKHLEDIGLISFNNSAGYSAQAQPRTAQAAYGPQMITFEFPRATGNEFALGKVMFTRLGAELFAISGALVDPSFLPYLQKAYATSGVRVTY